MSVRFFNSYMTTGSNAAACEFGSACSCSDNNALLLTLDTVIAVSIFVIIGLLLNGIISVIISVSLIVSLILIIRVILRTQFIKRPEPLKAL